MTSLSSFLSELKRRRVFRVLVGYCAAALVVIEAANNVFPAIELPAWAGKLVVVLALLGLPVALVLAWAFDVTPDGVRRTPDEPETTDPGPAPARAPRVRAWARYGTAAIVVAVVAVAAYTRIGRGADEGAGVPAAEPGRSIAVLPFRNMSGDPSNEYFSDGITEEILNALANVPDLRVAARTSSFVYKGKSEDVTAIGTRLHVTHILEGSVQRADDRVRITAQLIDARSGFHQWSNTYTLELKDVFAVEDEISRDVARQLQIRLAPGVVLARGGTDNPQAHDLYLQGLRLVRGGAELPSAAVWKANLLEAITIFQRALAVDSTYALAWTGIADAYSYLADDFWAPRDAYPKAKQAALRALALDPQLAEAHAALAAPLLWFDWDYAGADRALRRAVSLNPNDPVTHDLLATRYLQQHRFEEAAAEELIAARLDPATGRWETWAVAFRARAGDGDRLLDSLRAAVRALPRDQNTRQRLAVASLWSGEWRETAALLTGIERDFPDWYNHHDPLVPLVFARAGDTLAARRTLEVVLAHSRDHYVRPTAISAVYTALGEREPALGWLERAVRERDGTLQFLDVWDWWDPLRGDPRFEEIRREVGLPFGR